MFDLGLIVSYNVVEKATAYCIAIPAGARIACPRFVQMNPPRAAAAGNAVGANEQKINRGIKINRGTKINRGIKRKSPARLTLQG